MLTGTVTRAAPPRRRSRALSAGASLLAAFAFLAASLAVLVAGANSAAATGTRAASQAVGTTELAGHQPNHVRVTTADPFDAPQHPASPWTPVTVAPDGARVSEPAASAEHGSDATHSWHPYDATTAHGRAPPR